MNLCSLFNKIVKSKVFIFYLFVLALTSLKTGINVNDKNSSIVLYEIYSNIMDKNILIFLLMPIFLMLNGIINDIFDKSIVLIKYSHSCRWWKKKNIYLCIIAGVFCIFNNLSVLVSVFISGHMLMIDANFVFFFFYGMLLQFFGFIIIALVYQIIMQKLQYQFIAVLVPIFVLAFLGKIKFIFSMHPDAFYTLDELMTMNHVIKYEEIRLMGSDIIPLFGLFVLSTGFYLLGAFIIDKKDVYWR